MLHQEAEGSMLRGLLGLLLTALISHIFHLISFISFISYLSRPSSLEPLAATERSSPERIAGQ